MKKAIKIILIVIVVLLGIFYYYELDNKYIKKYIPFKGNIKGNIDTTYYTELGSEFEVGANWYGYLVFKYPDKAIAKIKDIYPNEAALLAEYTNRGSDISKNNIYAYMAAINAFSQKQMTPQDELRYNDLKLKYGNNLDFTVLNDVIRVYSRSYDRSYLRY